MSNKIANIGAEKMFLAERINANVAHRLVVDTWRTFDAVSPRQCPTKNYRLAITTLRTPDARSAQSNIVIVRFQSYAPTLRCRCVVTTRLIANKDYVTAPPRRPRRGFAVFAKCFRLTSPCPMPQPMYTSTLVENLELR